MPNGLELIAGELTMVVLVFTNSDLKITDEETDLLNKFRQAICGDNAFALSSNDYLGYVSRTSYASIRIDAYHWITSRTAFNT